MSARTLAALAALFAAGPAAAYVRSTDAGTGACLYWAPRSVTYRINPTRAGTSPSCGALSASDSGAADAVRAGFAAWTGAQEACTDLQLLEGAVTSEVRIGYDQGGSNENLVVFRKGWCSNDPAAAADPCWSDPAVRCSDTFGCFENSGRLGGQGIIALTTTTYAPATGEIVDADMEFIDWTGGSTGAFAARDEGWYFTCFEPGAEAACTSYGEAGCHSMDLQNTATHEAGHFVGLGHSPVANATMEATAAVGETKKRTLETDDVSGLCAIYPKAAATSVCVSPGKSKGGCSSGGGGGAGVLSLASLLALRWKGRRRRQRTTIPA
jgi:hypothetical protein